MNLLVKKIGLVLLPALFFACEDPTELGTTLNPNAGALSTHYVEIPVTTAQVRFDSVRTSMYGSVGAGNTVIWLNPYIGRISNNDLGTLKASLYANMALPAGTISIGSNTRIDSVKFQLVWNHRKVYGQLLEAPQKFDLYQLQQPISATSRTAANDTIDVLSYNYYAGDKEAVGELLGQLELSLAGIADKLDSATLNDVNRRIMSGHLDPAFGQQLLNDIKNNTGGILDSQEAFDDYFKGIALIPGDENTFLTTYNTLDPNSGLFIYYTQGTEQRTLRLSFAPSRDPGLRYSAYPAYFGIEADRSGTGIANAQEAGDLQDFQPLDGRLYFQGISGLMPKISFQGFKDFLASQGTKEIISINRAVLEFDSLIQGVDRQPLPSGVELFFVDENNKKFNSAIGGMERALSSVNRSREVNEKKVYYYESDVVYNLEQYLRSKESRYLNTILSPAEDYLLEPNAFVIRPNQVKLKIWYTKLNGPNL